MEALSPEVQGLRRARAVRLLLPLFFVSGATALVYQTLWARQLHLVFGTSTFAISTVLAAFMAGLALGGLLMARYADRVERPLAVYGALEIVIGVYAVIFPAIVVAIQPVYLSFWRAFEPGPVAYGVFQFVLVGAALLAPTTAMGATLPLLARFATERLGAAGDRVGLLYAVNTAGAVFGTWACGFLLLPALGLFTTTVLAAVANLALGSTAIALSRWAAGAETAPVEADLAPAARPASLAAVAAVSGIQGFSSLIFEVAWTRVLVLNLGASVYAFSVMLLAFLVGIAAGGRVGGTLADRLRDRSGPDGVLAALAGLQIGIAVLSWALMWVYGELPFLYVRLFDLTVDAEAQTWPWLVSLAVAGVVMTPPALLMGASFPIAVRAVVEDSDALGGPVGLVYGVNTALGAVGASLAGFVFLPSLGVRGTILLACSANLVAALVLVLHRRGRARWRVYAGGAVLAAAVLGLVARPPWNELVMTAAMYKYVSEFSDHSRAGILDYTVNRYDLLYYREGLSSVVTVAENRETRVRWLANNGKVDASTNVDMPTQILVALLPFTLTESVDDVVVIGLASGITAGATVPASAMRRLDVVELEPAIVEASDYFRAFNHDVLRDPRTTLLVNDGRNHLLLTPPGTYDVIVSEPSNPWISGVSNLFTRDFLEMAKTRLKPGGVWSQWIQMYGMAPDDLQALLATFADTYAYVAVFATIEDSDLVLVGSDRPLDLDWTTYERTVARWPDLAPELARAGVKSDADLLSLLALRRDDVLAMAGNIERNTDDNMRIEYSAPKNLHRYTASRNVSLMADHAIVPAAADTPERLIGLAGSYLHRDDWERAVEAAIRAQEAIAAGAGDAALTAHLADVRLAVGREDWPSVLKGLLVGANRARGYEEPPLDFLDAWDDWRVAAADYLEKRIEDG